MTTTSLTGRELEPDRIVAYGDAVNTIGTYSLAVLAPHHEIPLDIAVDSLASARSPE